MNSSPRTVYGSTTSAAAKRILAFAFAAVCTACATPAPNPSLPEAPPAFEHQNAGAAAVWPGAQWYQEFASDGLTSLIRLAQKNNFDVAAAQSRIRQADARARAAGAALLPQFDAVGNISDIRGRSGNESAHETDWSALLSASYEIDFWGRGRAAIDAARARVLAGQAESDTLKLTTLSSVATTYFQVLSLRERTDIAKASLELARGVLGAVQARYDAGMVTPVELAAQKAAVANAELAIPPLEQQQVEARGALALLVGQTPEGFTIKEGPLDELSEPAVSPGLPSELLARRPDVLSAETNLAAAHADLAAARAALFPTLTLTGSGGIQNPAVQAAVITLAGTGPAITVGASVVQSVFDGGRRRAVRDEAAAKEQELLANYRSTILSALVDVENALAAIQHLNLQQQPQTESLAQSERAFEGARLRYREGAADYLTMLDSQRTLYQAREQFSQYKLARLQAIVSLCKALGGGWQSPSASSASR